MKKMYKEGWKKLSEECVGMIKQQKLQSKQSYMTQHKKMIRHFFLNGAMANEVLECEEETRKVEDQYAELANDSNHETDTICEFNKKDVSAR